MVFPSSPVDTADLKKTDLYDSENKRIGNIIDFCVNSNYKLSRVILGGSFFEETKEKLGMKLDDDPVVPIDLFKEYDDRITISVPGSDLKNKLMKDVFEEDEMMFSDLKKRTVVGAGGKVIGRVVDALLYPGGKVDLVLGDSILIEFLEKIKLQDNYDLLLPCDEIKSIDDSKIYITKSKEELEIILDNQKAMMTDNHLHHDASIEYRRGIKYQSAHATRTRYDN